MNLNECPYCGGRGIPDMDLHIRNYHDDEFQERVKRRMAERAVDQAWELNWENRK